MMLGVKWKGKKDRKYNFLRIIVDVPIGEVNKL